MWLVGFQYCVQATTLLEESLASTRCGNQKPTMHGMESSMCDSISFIIFHHIYWSFLGTPLGTSFWILMNWLGIITQFEDSFLDRWWQVASWIGDIPLLQPLPHRHKYILTLYTYIRPGCDPKTSTLRRVLGRDSPRALKLGGLFVGERCSKSLIVILGTAKGGNVFASPEKILD